MKRAKVIHDNLNAGGGSERLAFATVELLNKMNFVVDLATLQKPNLEKAEENFGNDTSHLWKFNQIEILNMYSVLDINEHDIFDIYNKNFEDIYQNYNNKANTTFNDKEYDLVINTHGDLFPYYKIDKEYDNNDNKNNTKENTKNENRFNIESPSPINNKITYCHYPLVPLLIRDRNYLFLEQFFNLFRKFPQKLKDMIAFKVLEKYNQMINNTFILTNSKFSKQAIEKIYGKNNNVEATVIYPPVDVNKFKILNNCNTKNITNALLKEKDPDSILVISRLSPDKKIENAIEIGKSLKEKENIRCYKMTIVGGILPDNQNYLENLNNLIDMYDLKNNIKIKPNVTFDNLQKLVQQSSVYIHPTPDEPFGMSIVEAMSAGLIPITPNRGGDAEFVPLKYQYQSTEHATEIIANILKNNSNNKDLDEERKNISDSTNKFDKQKYNEEFENVIKVLLVKKEQTVLQMPKIRI
ncbi:MAG TPA: glycosyltransferase [Nitrososphaeraceae archaeon]|nr:glycosyltransferase [Nitrososphaeraceae archaeon]